MAVITGKIRKSSHNLYALSYVKYTNRYQTISPLYLISRLLLLFVLVYVLLFNILLNDVYEVFCGKKRFFLIQKNISLPIAYDRSNML